MASSLVVAGQAPAKSKPARGRPRVRDEDFRILQFGEQVELAARVYKKAHLKEMCKHFGLRVSGNKDELQSRVHDHLRLSVPAVCVQGAVRRWLIQSCARMRGPAFARPALAVNDTDFYSMAACTEIPVAQFFSTEDSGGKVYAFDVLSLCTLFSHAGRAARNPYNRQPFKEGTLASVKRLCRRARAIGHRVATRVAPTRPMVSFTSQVETLCHDIYLLGHYPVADWFVRLRHQDAVRFLREMGEVWAYRAGMPRSVREAIAPPDGNPFRGVRMLGLSHRPFSEVRRDMVAVAGRMVRTGRAESDRQQGALVVLLALTLASPAAAAAMPALHASAMYEPEPGPGPAPDT